MIRWVRTTLGVLGLAALLGAPVAANAGQITVFAAASLKNAMGEVAEGFKVGTGHDVVLSLAGSSRLAQQIRYGAPADIFLSASPDWMDLLQSEGLIDTQSRVALLGNTLVLVAHAADQPQVSLTPDLDLAALLNGGHLAMAMVDAVPAGIYAKAALQTLGLWDDVAAKVAQTDNVRTALALVSTGEAPLGIVYATDALAEPGVHVIARFAPDLHAPIVYPVAAVAQSDNALNAAFIAYLVGPDAGSIFERHGFAVLAP